MLKSKIKITDALITPLDTEETIKKKIAYHGKTIPEYILLDKIDSVIHENFIIYTNIENVARNEQYQGIFTYSDFFSATREWPLTAFTNLKVWLLAQNPDVFRENKFELVSLIQSVPILSDAFAPWLSEDIPRLLAGSFKNVQQWDKESKAKFAKHYRKDIELLKIFYKLQSVESSPFMLDRSNFQITLPNEMGYDLLDIFNMIVTSDIVPLAVVQTMNETAYYKIYKNIMPPQEWLDVIGDDTLMEKEIGIEDTIRGAGMIRMKLLGTRAFISHKIHSLYTDVELVIKNDTLIFTMQTITTKGITQNETVTRLSMALDLDFSRSQLTNVSIAGTFFIPLQYINMEIFADMVMNDPVVSRFLKIDENIKMQKKKTQTYIYFSDPDGEDAQAIIATANVTNQIVEKRDTLIKNTISQDQQAQFQPDSNYLRIRITRTRDLETLNTFHQTFTKLIHHYNNTAIDVINFYKMYGVELSREGRKVIKTTTKQWLKDIDPDIFGPVSNYARQCEKEREPRIVNETEAKILEADGKQTMKYPKDGAPGTQRYYVCDKAPNLKSGHIYPGVTVNSKTEHAKKYPMLPCCFKTNQVGGAKWRKYFDTDQTDPTGPGEQTVIAGRVIQGVKFLQIGQLGELPKSIGTLLETYSDMKAYRKGVANRTKNNFIECVLTVMDKEFTTMFGQNNRYTDEQAAYVIAKRIELADSNLENIRQENYEYTVEQIKQNILDQDTYFDPRRYVRLLENYYQCNIIQFTREGPDGTLILPNHIMNYTVWDHKFDTTIMIYEHMGSDEADSAEYPQCELIVIENPSPVQSVNTQIMTIASGSELFTKLNYLKQLMNKSYYLSLPNEPFPIPPWIINDVGVGVGFGVGVGSSVGRVKQNPNFSIESQYIDNYGKTRILNVMFRGQRISIMTNPLPNLAVTEATIEESQSSGSITAVVELIQYLDATITKKVCILQNGSKVCKELHGSSGQFQFIFSINFDNNLDDSNDPDELILMNKICTARNIFNTMQEFNSKDRGISKLDEFNRLRNIANWLSQYNYWLFSKYCQEHKIPVEMLQQQMYQNIFEQYVASTFVIIPNHDYQTPVQIFSMDSTILQNGKLIISGKSEQNSQDIARRLIYTLRMQLQHEPSYQNGVKNLKSVQFFHEKKIMSDRYQDIDDFKKYHGEIIFSSVENIYKWIEQQSRKIILSYNILTGYQTPYLLKNNELTGGQIVLCHCTDMLWKAYNIGIVWARDHYNPVNIETVSDLAPVGAFNLLIPNGKEAEIHRIDGELSKYPVNIVGYLNNGVPEYTTLLFL